MSFVALLRRVLVALSGAAVVACVEDPVSPEINSLAEAQALWDRTRPASNSYVIAQQVACFCPDGGTTYEVTVTQGVITRARNTQGNSDVPADRLSRFRTVDQLFNEVRAALGKADVLRDVAYDTIRGFPTTVSLDPIKNAVDDEVAYFTNQFVKSP